MIKVNSELRERLVNASRRSILSGGVGLGALALLQLSRAGQAISATPAIKASPAALTDKGILGAGKFPARAKRVLHIMMWGGMSQCDTFDYKPTLVKMHGKELPPSVRQKGGRVSTMSGAQSSFPCIAPAASFHQYGESGAWVSDLLPAIGEIIDEFTVVRSMYTEHVNHDPAAKFLHTGFQLSGRPSAGAWVNYALGSDNANLPSFVAMCSGGQGGVGVDASAWSSGFLPSHHQGVLFGDGADPVLYVSSPEGIDKEGRRAQLDVLHKIANAQTRLSNDPEIASKMTQYEMAYRMQESVPDVVDLASEPAHVIGAYGPDVVIPGTFARNCVLARRLLERDVKFVQLMHTGWDAHSFLQRSIAYSCQQVDQPIAALVSDLKQRGLLEDTLVVISTEFGRTAFAQGQFDSNSYGRDHHGPCFTYLLAGAGVKAGHVYGETDEFSYNIASNPVHIHDMQATMLYLLGIDHELLTYHYQGRDFRLTDVAGKVVKGILA
ncbi:MAG: DUF1501 domain-containing protein [Pseudomonadota bacterium]